jgi:glycerophosphoryl diester phosphodiesterase
LERENTISAFSKALLLGASGLETDAWLSADGVVVLDHDGLVGPIWKRRAISVTARSDLPGHVPPLRELYLSCGTSFELSVDVKDPFAFAPLVAEARFADASRKLWLCYHDWRLLASWRRDAPEARLVESTSLKKITGNFDAHLSCLVGAGIDALNLHRSQWTAPLVRLVHTAGLAALAWDAQTPAALAEMVGMGVDGVYCDDVATMVSALGSERPQRLPICDTGQTITNASPTIKEPDIGPM